MGSKVQGNLEPDVGGFVSTEKSRISLKRIAESEGEDSASEESSFPGAILALSQSPGSLQEAELLQFRLKEAAFQHQLPLPLPISSAFGCEATVLAKSAVPSFSTSCAHQQRKKRVMEKTTKCRQKRMINNRESAARSRGRRQAYINELEIEVTRLIEENAKLKMQGVSESLIPSRHSQQMKNILRRTLTAPF